MKLNDNRDPRRTAIPDVHGHAKGEHKPYAEERPIPLSARMLFLWFFHACRRGYPRFMMVSDHMNYLTFEDPAAVNLVRRALKLAQAGDLYGAAETANVDVAHAKVVSDGLRRGMRYAIGAEVDNDPRSRPDAQNIVDSMKPDGMIRAVHFLTIDHPQYGAGWNWGFDNPEFAAVWEHVGTEKAWELYIAAVLDAIERLPGNILGHFYVPAVFGNWPDDAVLERYEDEVIAALAARGMAVEINSRFLYRHPEEDENRARFIAANTRLLKKAKAAGVPITVGADAHSPRDQGNAYDVVLAMLDAADVNELVFPIGGKFARVQLRPEVRAEPERPPVPPPAPPKAPAPEPVHDEPAAEAIASETRAPRTGSARTTASPAASDDRPTKARTGSRRATVQPEPSVASQAPQQAEAQPEAAPEPVAESEPPAPETQATAEPAPAEAAVRKPRRSPIAPPAVVVKAKAVPPKAAPPKPLAKKAPAARAAAPAKPAPKAKAVVKPAAKKATPVKAVAKPAPAKPAPKAKAKAAKSVAKPPAKAKPLAKPAPKPAGKAAAARTAKPAAKAAVKKAPAKKASAKKAPAKKAPPKRR